MDMVKIDQPADTKAKGRTPKLFEIHPNNQIFYDEFSQKFGNNTSWAQYKVDCGAFLSGLRQKLLTSIAPNDIEEWVTDNAENETTRSNKRAHIRSMVLFAVRNDIRGAKGKVSRDLLIYLL